MANRTVTVSAYRDAEKTDLVTGIPIIDLGVVAEGETKPMGAEGLIHIAKLQLRATTSEDVEGLFYDVTENAPPRA